MQFCRLYCPPDELSEMKSELLSNGYPDVALPLKILRQEWSTCRNNRWELLTLCGRMIVSANQHIRSVGLSFVCEGQKTSVEVGCIRKRFRWNWRTALAHRYRKCYKGMSKGMWIQYVDHHRKNKIHIQYIVFVP